ncbi:hypothetical protein [Ottowia sp.]|uniref:hypothetical protein n=1 Tax=Ottowia sp. TaxID=1898956 RepID=UPI0025F4777B|nr:hypothetical protein [Ottowia sp.]MBK6612611.1 hypothetical protein [Ottowia sp.]
MRQLMIAHGADNPHQFADLVSDRTGTFQDPGKWRANFNGVRPFSAQQLQLLRKLDATVSVRWTEGPSGLWIALWGDALADQLWRHCRIRFSNDGPGVPDGEWIYRQATFFRERFLQEAVRELEGELLLAEAYGEPLSVRYLSEAIMVYRLCQAVDALAKTCPDAVGPYRCVHLCLGNAGIQGFTQKLGVHEMIEDEVVGLEVSRLQSDWAHRSAVGIGVDNMDALVEYACDPRNLFTDEERWTALNFEWCPND